MVREIIWTRNAQIEQLAIFEYWTLRTKSKRYSGKLRRVFKTAAKQIQQYPFSGISTTVAQDIRLKIAGHFLLFYKIEPDRVLILSIFDSRRNPEDLPFEY